MERELVLDNATRKSRILNYLAYMDDKSLQEIALALYNLAKSRHATPTKKEAPNDTGE